MCLAYIECLHLDGARSCAERPVCAQGVEIYTRLPARFVTGPLELVSPKSASARSWIAETVARVALPFWLSFPARAALVSPSALVRPSATDKRVFFFFFQNRAHSRRGRVHPELGLCVCPLPLLILRDPNAPVECTATNNHRLASTAHSFWQLLVISGTARRLAYLMYLSAQSICG